LIAPALEEEIKEIAGRYPDGRSALLPALELVQRAGGGSLTHEDVRQVGRLLGVPSQKAWGAATFYSMLRTAPVGRYHLQVDTNVPALLAGAGEIFQSLKDRLAIGDGETTADGLFTLSAVEDLGCADVAPVIRVNDTVYGHLDPEKALALIDALGRGEEPVPDLTARHDTTCGVLLKNFHVPAVEKLAVSLDQGGYRGLEKARGLGPSAVIAAVEESGLRGRGGAAFPTGRKWRLLSRDERPVYLICNADEGEPGTFKDRRIMESDPHLLVEGIAIAAHAIGAAGAFVYIRGEYRTAAGKMEQAVKEAREGGLLNDLTVTIHRGAGSYICGEETALIASLEGGRGEPSPKPPYPAEEGLYGCPTVVNNVETLASLPFILSEGADAFREISPALFSLSGHVRRPGLYERRLGTPLANLLEDAGGVTGGLKAVIVGGLSSPILPARRALGLTLDYESCRAAGSSLGSGAVIVINDTVPIPDIALRAAGFFAGESCGQCAPCREGTETIRLLLRRAAAGDGTREDIDKALEICRGIKGANLCPGGDTFASSIEAMVTRFRREFP
jgi:NADH:ubiquinone oxidoreductase subunit F (NADH-binding)/NADH:ubiquinone oxidoreductase subunit E